MPTNPCPLCGVDINMVGKRHRCVPQKRLHDKDIPATVVISSGDYPHLKLEPITSPSSSQLRGAYNQYMRDYMRKWRARKKEK